MMSENREYNQKIEMMHALGPVAFLSHCFSPAIRVIAPFIYWIEVLAFVPIFPTFFINFCLHRREWHHCWASIISHQAMNS